MVFGVMIGCTLCHPTSLSTSPNWCDIFSIMVCIIVYQESGQNKHSSSPGIKLKTYIKGSIQHLFLFLHLLLVLISILVNCSYFYTCYLFLFLYYKLYYLIWWIFTSTKCHECCIKFHNCKPFILCIIVRWTMLVVQYFKNSNNVWHVTLVLNYRHY